MKHETTDYTDYADCLIGKQSVESVSSVVGGSRTKMRCRLVGRMRGSRRGTTLVELLIAMLILTIVCIAWLEIIGIQSARKEARRREAVERLAGTMDAFLYNYRLGGVSLNSGYHVAAHHYLEPTNGVLTFAVDRSNKQLYPVFKGDVSPIRYRLYVKASPSGWPQNSQSMGWKYTAVGRGGSSSCSWLVGELYDKAGDSGTVDDSGRPFFTLPICLGF